MIYVHDDDHAHDDDVRGDAHGALYHRGDDVRARDALRHRDDDAHDALYHRDDDVRGDARDDRNAHDRTDNPYCDHDYLRPVSHQNQLLLFRLL